MKALNKIQLIGNVGNAPEIRSTPSGSKVAKLSIATNRTWKDRDGTVQEKTDWHRCTFFGQIADVVEKWIHKGDRLYVEGRIEYSTSEADGVKKYFTDIVVQELVMLGGVSESVAPQSQDIPF